MSSSYAYLTATTLVKPMAGVYKGIFVSAASSTPTITVYDTSAASGAAPAIIGTFTPVAGTSYILNENGVYANHGIRVEITGTVSCTVVFE
jgi:hypothetical protein